MKSNLVVCGWKKGTLYVIELSTQEVNSNSDDVGDPSTLCHQRLCHMSEKGMKILVSNGNISELKGLEIGFCEPCVFGK